MNFPTIIHDRITIDTFPIVLPSCPFTPKNTFSLFMCLEFHVGEFDKSFEDYPGRKESKLAHKHILPRRDVEIMLKVEKREGPGKFFDSEDK